MEKILASIKKQLGANDSVQFDPQIIMAINTAMSALTQIGIGPAEGFLLTDADAEWSDFIGEGPSFISAQMYIYCKSKILFDPPANQTLLNALKEQAAEIEWRLRTEKEDHV